jgi:hypothetical protein
LLAGGGRGCVYLNKKMCVFALFKTTFSAIFVLTFKRHIQTEYYDYNQLSFTIFTYIQHSYCIKSLTMSFTLYTRISHKLSCHLYLPNHSLPLTSPFSIFCACCKQFHVSFIDGSLLSDMRDISELFSKQEQMIFGNPSSHATSQCRHGKTILIRC